MQILKRLRLYFETLRYLTSQQVFYQVFYRVKKQIVKAPSYSSLALPPEGYLLTLEKSISSAKSLNADSFTFLNLERTFEKEIDWNFAEYGKLWTYNLNYFDFLLQEHIEHQQGLALVESFCAQPERRITGVEPYPISLRGINWIKYFCYHKVQNPKSNALLFEHYRYLASNLEYHLMGNHLLENGFSLLFGAYYFRNEKFYIKASEILRTQLNEQILNDGAHFELSPMYHQIILFRLLDCINLLRNNYWKNDDLLSNLTKKAIRMISWLKAITFQNGEVPMVNDSAYGISPTTDSIVSYADRLGIIGEPCKLSDSGYRMIRLAPFELFIDVGAIGPDYIPGHAHSDTLNFILYVAGQPMLVDTATSTYENNSVRLFERSTEAHNTVMYDDRQQSEVWSSFRVGRRAKIMQLEEGNSRLTASHDGYKSIGIIHKRSWSWGENGVVITDEISGKRQGGTSIAYFHFHPDIEVITADGTIHADLLEVECHGQNHFEIGAYNFATGFNKTQKGKVLKVHFNHELQTVLRLRNNLSPNLAEVPMSPI